MRLPPPDFGLQLSPRVHVCDEGRTLMGSGRVLRLNPSAVRIVQGYPTCVGDDPTAARLARLLLDRGLADPWWPTPLALDEAVTDVTLVVPTRDRAEALDRLLSTVPATVPVLVVDDGSVDAEALARVCRDQGARLLQHPENLGPAAARNTGLRAVRTPYVAFCDSDVVPEPGWLSTLRRHLDDPAVALVGPRVLGRSDLAAQGWLGRYEQARSSLDLGERAARVALHGEVAYLPSAALIARVGALGPGFDESMRCGEDVDLVWRLLADGWGVRYDPAAVVRHDHRTSLPSWLGRKAFYGTSAAPLAARHDGAVAPLVATPFTAAVMVALLAQRRWSLPLFTVAAAVATAATARRLGSGDRPVRAAGVLVLEGSVAAGWQTASALTRHYWPLVAMGALRSKRVRRAALVAGVVEGVLDWRRVRPDLDLPRYVAAHRLDDLAYGAGVWTGAARARSPRALLPRLVGWRSPSPR